jgi:hypothetical protein
MKFRVLAGASIDLDDALAPGPSSLLSPSP